MIPVVREATVVTSAEDARKLGRYVLVGELGEGGMGRVYLARATGHEGFEKLVAVKVMSPGIAERHPEMAEMFLDEARIGALLRHPNICSVLDFGEAQGVRFIVMEYLEGQSLLGILKRLSDRPDVRNDPRFTVYAARILAEACEGLHGAHTAVDPKGRPLRVVHRDVSPENLFVTYDGAIKVMDFGIARARSRSYETADSSFKGKIAYAAPEALENAPLDPTTDVWGVGVVLWELLVGEPLFLRDNEAGTVGAVLVEAIRAPAQLDSRVPLPLNAIVMRALERDRGMRYRSARELARELNRFAAASGEHIGTAELSAFVTELFPSEREVQVEVTRVARGIASAARGARELEAEEASRSLVASEVRPSAITREPSRTPAREAGGGRGGSARRSPASEPPSALLPIHDLGQQALPRVSSIHVEPTMITPMERPARGGKRGAKDGAAAGDGTAKAAVPSKAAGPAAAPNAVAAKPGAAKAGAAKPGAPKIRSPKSPSASPRRSWVGALVPVAIACAALVTGIAIARLGSPSAAPAAPPPTSAPNAQAETGAGQAESPSTGPGAPVIDRTGELYRATEEARARAESERRDRERESVEVVGASGGRAPAEPSTDSLPREDVERSRRDVRETRTAERERRSSRATSDRRTREARPRGREPTTPPVVPTGTTGTVNVFASGSWADIYEGNRLLGRTPARLRLPVGRHTLTLRPPNGASVRRTVTVSEGSSTNLRVEL